MKKSMDAVLAGRLILCIVLAILEYFLLPDTLVMQITASGAAGTTLPKLLGILISTAFSAFALFWYKKDRGGQSAVIVSAVAVLIGILTLAFNLGR